MASRAAYTGTEPSPAPSGDPGALEPGGLWTPTALVFYKVRGLSPCTGSIPGATKD